MAGPATPDSIGPYRVLRRLGQGAMGSVYLAVDPADGSAVALKVLSLPDDGESAAQAARQFELEASAARRLNHPDIVALRAAGQASGQAWLAMDVAPGVPLERYTQPARLLPEAVALRVCERVAGALAYAHAHGVVHRDIKPSNVMVDWASDRVTLTDFGVARAADSARTRTGVVIGSPAYLPPEQLAGAEPAAAGDLYSLGVTLFQLLAGRLPHDGASMGELLRQVATLPAPDLATLRPDLPAGVAVLVSRLLAKRAADRPASAAEVAKTLHALCEQLAPREPAAGAGAKSRP